MYLNKAATKELCKELLDDFDQVLSWKWDNGFNALIAEFPTEKQTEVRSILERHLGITWDSNSIRKAPDTIKVKSGDLGDLRDKQLLFTTDPEAGVLIFAAWWPWGNGEVISVRIASPATGDVTEGPRGIVDKIKSFFG